MSNGHPPICDPVCQKILLDGEELESSATDACNLLKRVRAEGSAYSDPNKVVAALIRAEIAVMRVKRTVLEELGYTGELPPWYKV